MATEDEKELAFVRSEISRRQIHLGGPKKMADMLAVLMAKRGYAQIETTDSIVSAWHQIVGPAIAKVTNTGNIVRGTLEVFVKNSVVMQELTFQKKQLVKKITASLPEHKIKDIRFRIGPIE